ncbi:hypothetical protein MMC22_009772 [Lobaria immixta]|nr:hypothetical protein [Lobaria immixta]
MHSPRSLVDENRGPGEVALIVVLTVISAIIVILRVYSKLFVIRGIGWDDGMMVVAVIFSFVYEAANIVNIKYGSGRHHRFLNNNELYHNAKWGFMAGILYNLTIFFVKFSVILFLLRIGKLKRWVRIVIYLDLFLVFGSLATAVIVQLVQCIPITHNWHPDIHAHCLPPRTLTIVSYVSSGSSIGLTTWGVAEIHSGIVAASIPALRALVVCTATRLRTDSKLGHSSYESRNPYRHRARNQYDDDDGTSTFPLRERSQTANEGGIVKTTEFEVTNATRQKVEVRSEGEGGILFSNSTLDTKR